MAKRYYNYEEMYRTVKGVKQKRCTKCKTWKDESEFHKDRARRDGLRIYCKGCAEAYVQKHRGKNRKSIREYLSYEDRHRVVRGIKEKLCCCCKKWKYESQFSRNCWLKDGLALYCKECERNRCKRIIKTGRRNLRYEDRRRVVNGVKEKLCRKCKKWKSESEFYKNRSCKDGLTEWCKDCTREHLRARYKKAGKGLRTYRRYEECHRVVDGVKQKRCRGCRRWKRESEFYKNRSCKDGLTEWCKDCGRERIRAYNKKAGKGLKTYRRYEECHRVVDGVKQKQCRKCRRWKRESEFYKVRSGKDGLTGRCKKCLYKATNKSRNKRRTATRK